MSDEEVVAAATRRGLVQGLPATMDVAALLAAAAEEDAMIAVRSL